VTTQHIIKLAKAGQRPYPQRSPPAITGQNTEKAVGLSLTHGLLKRPSGLIVLPNSGYSLKTPAVFPGEPGTMNTCAAVALIDPTRH